MRNHTEIAEVFIETEAGNNMLSGDDMVSQAPDFP